MNRIIRFIYLRRKRLPMVMIILVLIAGVVYTGTRPSKGKNGKSYTDAFKHTYSVVNQTVKINNQFYNGRALIQDDETREIYIPADELTQSLGKNISLEKAESIEHDDIEYVAISSLHSKIGLNVNLSDDNIYYIDDFPDLDYTWARENRMIAHSMGGIDGKKYLNCREGFVANYKKGFRVFEADIALTTDGVPVLLHSWKGIRERAGDFRINSEPFDYDNFKDILLDGKYHTLSIQQVAEMIRDFDEDVYLILDTKSTEPDEAIEIYEGIVKYVSKVDPSILDRFIPQIYNDDLISAAFDTYSWKSAIYTMYLQESMSSNMHTFENAYKAGIRVFVMNSDDYDATLVKQAYDINGWVYMHSYNDMKDVDMILKKTYVYGFYSDFLPPDSLENYKYPPELE